MKNITRAVSNPAVKMSAVAILLFINLSLVYGQTQIARNGGFETGDFTGWEQTLINGTQAVGAFSPTEGSFAANLNNTVPGTASLIKNNNIAIGVVNPGDNITITFDARGEVGIGGVAFAELFSELSGGGTSASVILGGGPLALDADPEVWTSFTFTSVAGPDVSGGLTLQLKADTGASALANIFFDNVSIIDEDVTLSVGDNLFETQSLNLYPNPAQDILILDNSESIALQNVMIYDLRGRLLETIDVTDMGTERTIDVSSLETATYLFVIETATNQITKRFVKQ